MDAAITDRYVRSTPFEVATGWIHGLLPATPLPLTAQSPREALDDAIRPALINAPCHVTFSGGRDSSAVLAAATALARREGHLLPIPVTRVYPGIPDTDESKWQRMVMEHLDLREWIRFEFTRDDTDLLGEAAQKALHRRGVVWPPAIQTHGAMFHHLSGGSVMTGEGGDAVLGMRRGTALTLLRRGRSPSRPLLQSAATALMPRRVRQPIHDHSMRRVVDNRWLQPSIFARHLRLTAADESHEPLRYDEGTWFITRRRFFAAATHNYSVAASDFGLQASDPLLDPGFLAALAHSGGGWGYNGRTATMRALFGDVLPEPVLSRSTKARFNSALTGGATMDFAASWDGSGVDPALVDVDKLRAMWLSDEPTMGAGLLLHSAWLATRGAST